MKKQITSQDIARMANVSQSTVSRALNPNTSWRISSAKRAEILDLCQKYHYKLPTAKTDKKFRKTFKVGLLLGSMERDLLSLSFRLRLLCDQLQSCGYTLTLIRVDFSKQKLAQDVKKILKSAIADIYLVDASLLHGQTVELLNEIGSRVICDYAVVDDVSVQKQHQWLSTVIYDYNPAFEQAVQTIPREYFDSMIFWGWKNKSFEGKLRLLKKYFNKYNIPVSKLKTITFERQQSLYPGTSSYRIAREEVHRKIDMFKNHKLFWCSGRNSADALNDELQASGLVCGRDYQIVTFNGRSDLKKNYEFVNDDYCFISHNIDIQANKFTELIMTLIDDPTPRHETFPTFFIPSKSLTEQLKNTSQE